MPFLQDVILLVLQHYTASQIGDWVTKYRGVAIGRHAVGRFVRRIQLAVDNSERQVTRTDVVLGEAIRKAAASRYGALPPMMTALPTVETSKRKEGRTVTAPSADAESRVPGTATGIAVSPPEVQGGSFSEREKPPAERSVSGMSSRLIPSRAELDMRSAKLMQNGKPQLMSSDELARMMRAIEDEASEKKE